MKGHTEIVSNLLENGAHIDTQDNKGWSALLQASVGGHTETVCALLEKRCTSGLIS